MPPANEPTQHQPTQLELIDDVRRACLAADGVDPLDEAARLRLRHHGLDGVDAVVEPAGFALRDGERLDLAVAPEARGQGVGGRLAAAALAVPGPVAAWSHTDHPAAAALAARHGFVRARELWVMRRSTASAVPEVAVPPGVRIRAFSPGDEAAVLAVNAAAFAAHPEQGDLDAAGLEERMAEDWFDPAGLLLAVDEDDVLLGFHWTKDHGGGTGEVYVVGTAPAAQGRGLGRALTVAGLRHLASRGAREVLLYVEADNGAALRLYSGLGFTHAPDDTHVHYRNHPDRTGA